MKFTRICLAIAVLGACGAASAQQAFVTQSGSNDQASVEQTNAPGSMVTVNQSGGSGNTANSLQANTGPGATTATITQQGTTASTGRITQINVKGTTSISFVQTGASGSTADLGQFDSTGGTINANQSGVSQHQMVQQMSGSIGAYVRTNQVGSNSSLTIVQGQPNASVTNSQSRVFQWGDANDGFTLQANGSNQNAYVQQGGSGTPGSYYVPQTNTFVLVDNVPPTQASNAVANVFQNSGSNHTAYILQYGTGHNGTIMQAGESNFGGILQTGTANGAYISQSGMGDTATVSQRGTAAYANVTQSGVGNRAAVTQR